MGTEFSNEALKKAERILKLPEEIARKEFKSLNGENHIDQQVLQCLAVVELSRSNPLSALAPLKKLSEQFKRNETNGLMLAASVYFDLFIFNLALECTSQLLDRGCTELLEQHISTLCILDMFQELVENAEAYLAINNEPPIQKAVAMAYSAEGYSDKSEGILRQLIESSSIANEEIDYIRQLSNGDYSQSDPEDDRLANKCFAEGLELVEEVSGLSPPPSDKLYSAAGSFIQALSHNTYHSKSHVYYAAILNSLHYEKEAMALEARALELDPTLNFTGEKPVLN